MKTYWDDLNVGDQFRGDEVVADPDEMLAYARRNDPQPFHVDEEAAKTTPFGGLIASGGYTVTLWYRSGIPVLKSIAFLGGSEWHIKLQAPVRPNDRLQVRMRVTDLRASSRPGRGYATVHHEIVNQDNQVVFTADVRWILRTRP